MQILGIYVILLGIISAVFDVRLGNLSFLQFHIGRTASIFIGLCMVLIGNGLKARTRISWYLAIGLIFASLISIIIRGFSLVHLDIIGAIANISILSILIYYRKEYIFPSINLSIEGKLALFAISHGNLQFQ